MTINVHSGLAKYGYLCRTNNSRSSTIDFYSLVILSRFHDIVPLCHAKDKEKYL
jgi:hypothetical protein